MCHLTHPPTIQQDTLLPPATAADVNRNAVFDTESFVAGQKLWQLSIFFFFFIFGRLQS